MMPLIELGVVDVEGFGGPPACVAIPAIGEQHAANVQKQSREGICNHGHRSDLLATTQTTLCAPHGLLWLLLRQTGS